MALTLKTTGIAANAIGVLVNDAGTIKLFRSTDPTNPLTVGAGLTASGTITAEVTPTTYNGTSVYEITVAADSMLEVDGTITWDWSSANGTAVFAAFTSMSDNGDAGCIVHNGNVNYNSFTVPTQSNRFPTAYFYGGSTTMGGSTAIPIDGTDFSTGFRFKNSDATGDCAVWTGIAGSAGSFTGSITTGGWTDSTGSLKRFFRDTSTGINDLVGKCIMVAVFNTKAISDSDFAALHADPIGTLFTGGSSLTKKLKVLTHSSAASATSIAGAVFAVPSGANITGTKIGEFTGKTFEASLESGQAVLKVPVADFGGGSLTTSDTPVVLVRNTTNTTGIIPATIIEE